MGYVLRRAFAEITFYPSNLYRGSTLPGYTSFGGRARFKENCKPKEDKTYDGVVDWDLAKAAVNGIVRLDIINLKSRPHLVRQRPISHGHCVTCR